MSTALEIPPVNGPIRGTIRPPGSKSLTNRALVIAALAQGESTLTGVLDSRDTRVMVQSLRQLGFQISASAANTANPLDVPVSSELRLTGRGGVIPQEGTRQPVELWLENSGTSIRFLTAVCPLGKGRYRLDGNVRMRERPIQPLVTALSQTGAHLTCELGTGCPPVLVNAQGLAGGTWTVSGNLSSQYLSALLQVAPCAQSPVELCVTGELVSRPYVDMTIALMRQFGAEVTEPTSQRFLIAARPYVAQHYDIEPDASAASYFFGAAAVTGGTITVEGLHRNALQGDVAFVDALVRMGCQATWNDRSITLSGPPAGQTLRGIDIDMNAISDTAQTLACVAPFAQGPTTIRNVAHMRLKETDRVLAVVTELRKLGLKVTEFPDGLRIEPGPLRPANIATYDDHRMAMSFSLIGLRQPGVRIEDPQCTAKTYPNFFDDLFRLTDGR